MDRELTGDLAWWNEVLLRILSCDLFIFALSQASVASESCLQEFEYAMPLGKPVLPVTVRKGASDALPPPTLAEIQRVDYSSPDASEPSKHVTTHAR